jgi:hypothetical protein
MSLKWLGLRRIFDRHSRCGNDRNAPQRRLRLECLEDRSVPATFTVSTTLDVINPTDGKLSLREAISKANANPGADTIVLPAGVYKITLAGAGEDANATGDFDITDAVTIAGAGAGLTVVDGQQLDRVFDISGDAPSSMKVVLQGLTVRNGDVTGHGGGIQVGNEFSSGRTDLVVRDCIVSGNRATQTGGGISNVALTGSGDVTLVGTTVSRNVAGEEGGGIDAAGTGGPGSLLTITSSTVRQNLSGRFGGGIRATTVNLTSSTVSGNSAGNGGAGVFAPTVKVTNSTINGNSTTGGGGAGIEAGTLTLTNSTVSGNSNGDDAVGGGIQASTATLTNSTVSGNSTGANGGGIDAGTITLTNCTVSGNTSRDFGGGGIDASTATLTNCTVSGNSAGLGIGGGIEASTATLVNCTIAENLANNDAGGLFQVPGGTFTLRNTIVALNLVAVGGTSPDVSGAFTSQGHNLIGDGTGGTGFGTNFDIVGTGANPIDPKLGALANNGGPTQTMALKAGSPAIDHGDNTVVNPVTGKPLTTDQRGAGFPRKKDGDGNGIAIVDIGAFER